MPFICSEKLYPAAIMGSVVMLLGAWRLLFVPEGSSLGDVFAILRAASCATLVLTLKRYGEEIVGFVNFSVAAFVSLVSAGISGQT